MRLGFAVSGFLSFLFCFVLCRACLFVLIIFAFFPRFFVEPFIFFVSQSTSNEVRKKINLTKYPYQHLTCFVCLRLTTKTTLYHQQTFWVSLGPTELRFVVSLAEECELTQTMTGAPLPKKDSKRSGGGLVE